MLADVTRRLQGILAELRRLPAVLGATVARRDGILIARKAQQLHRKPVERQIGR